MRKPILSVLGGVLILAAAGQAAMLMDGVSRLAANAVPSEMMVVADHKRFHTDLIDQLISDKLHRTQPGKLLVKRLNNEVVNPK